MQQVTSVEAFLNDPVARWVTAGSSVVWCARPELCGAVTWGKPTEADTALLLRAFDGYLKLAPKFDLLLDGSRVSAIDPLSLAALVTWLVREQEQLIARVRLQIGVIDDSMVGVTLSGILPVLGDTHRFRVVRSPEEAFAALAPEDGVAICAEVEAAVAQAAGEPRELRALRLKLREHQGRLTLDQAARELGMSTRTLQRTLGGLSTTYQDELRAARFAVAETLLCGTDEKIASIAARVGVTEGVLTRIVRDETGLTPGDLRKRGRTGNA